MNKIAVSLVHFLFAEIINWIFKVSSENSVIISDYVWMDYAWMDKKLLLLKKSLVAHHLAFFFFQWCHIKTAS